MNRKNEEVVKEIIRTNPTTNGQKNTKKTSKKKIKRDVARVLNKNPLFREQILAMNPYLLSLLDPFNVHGARIPDLVMFPSCPLSVVVRTTVTINANGVAGVVYGIAPNVTGASASVVSGSMIPLRTSRGDGSFSWPIGISLSPTASTSNIFDAADTIPNRWIQYPSQTDTNRQLSSNFQKLRIVSYAANIQYTGTALDSKGKITSAAVPRNTFRSVMADTAQLPISIDRVSQSQGSRTCPINLLSGSTALYKPVDSRSLNYADINAVTGVPSEMNQWENDYAPYCGSEIFLLVDGGTPGATLQCTLVVNFEAISRTNTVSIIQSSPSPSDPIALSHAVNAIQVTPSVVSSSKEEMGIVSGKEQLNAPQSTPTIHAAQEQPSMFDKILGGLGSFVNGSTKAIKTIAPLASLLMSAL